METDSKFKEVTVSEALELFPELLFLLPLH